MPETARSDEVLAALDGLVEALRASTSRTQEATRRAQSIRRLRSKGQSYREILGHTDRALLVQTTREHLDRLLQASGRLRRAQVRALYAEGMTMEQIAGLFGVTRQRVSGLLRDSSQRDGNRVNDPGH